MDWVQDMTARWMRIMSAAAGGGGTPLDEAVRQINAIGDASGKKGRPGWLRGKAAAVAEASEVTVLARQLVAGVLVCDMAIGRLCALEGKSRGQVLAQLAGDVPGQLPDQQLSALWAELSGSCASLQDSQRASYAGLGDRIERLLRLAEEQALELVEAARAEAAAITASAGAPPPAPGTGRDDCAEGHQGP
jgi:hypothetical protein